MVLDSSVWVSRKKQIIVWVGAATFFFGFGAGAILNWYLIIIQSPLVTQLRSSLTFVSAIIGDGIVLPIVNMMITAFLIKHRNLVSRKLVYLGMLFGALITAYFHISQAVNNLVNWAMPSPWQWNALGVWHALYMFSVCSLISLFYITLMKFSHRARKLPIDAMIITLGILFFLLLLKIDYMSVRLENLVP